MMDEKYERDGKRLATGKSEGIEAEAKGVDRSGITGRKELGRSRKWENKNAGGRKEGSSQNCMCRYSRALPAEAIPTPTRQPVKNKNEKRKNLTKQETRK
jgi:hypothetical protein